MISTRAKPAKPFDRFFAELESSSGRKRLVRSLTSESGLLFCRVTENSGDSSLWRE